MESTIRLLCELTSCRKMSGTETEDLKNHLAAYGQEHLLKFWSRLNAEQKASLISDIKAINMTEVMSAYEECNRATTNEKLDLRLEPIPEELHEGVARCSSKQLEAYRIEGLKQIAEGRVAALLLAGGQGTRLGGSCPKGMYDIGLPSQKTLYQLQGERLLRLQKLAFDQTGKEGNIPWYIMTSEHTRESTLDFFAKHDYFGLKKENLVVFEQYMLPCFTFDGKIILETPWKIAKAPDGNGGLFRALKRRGILDDMVKRGIKYIHVYCVDNILVKMADPVFTGYCISKNANCAAKVVEKVVPTESVGVVCRVDGKFQVVEYSEVSRETAQKRNPDGRLTFSAGNICNHFFNLDFLQEVGNGMKKPKHHMAKKKIPYVDDDGNTVTPTQPNGTKLEKFVFDVFVFSDKFAAWEVIREDEFSPLKNSDNSEKDNPTTARNALYALHCKYIKRAGGNFTDRGNSGHFISMDLNENSENEDPSNNYGKSMKTGICEISPLVSYDGEGLKELVSGKLFTGTVLINPRNEDSVFHLVKDKTED